jgi:hypothetical protein
MLGKQEEHKGTGWGEESKDGCRRAIYLRDFAFFEVTGFEI